LLTFLTPVKTAWEKAYGDWKNAQAGYRSASQVVQNLFDTLQLKPVGGGRSLLDDWESKVSSYWATDSAIYSYLFPRGRESLNSGTIEEVVNEVARLVTRLEKTQTDLNTLAAAPGNTPAQTADYTEQAAAMLRLKEKVAAFSLQLGQARTAQTGQEGALDQLSPQVEAARVEVVDALYKNLADLMSLFYLAKDRLRVEGFFDLTLIMNPPVADDASPDPAVPPPPVG
jgi:hypothetical protein